MRIRKNASKAPASRRPLGEGAQTEAATASPTANGQRCAGHKDGVWSADPVEKRDHGYTGQRSAAEVSPVEQRNAPRFAGEYDGKENSGEEKGHGGGEIDDGEIEKIFPGNFECYGHVQHDLENEQNRDGVEKAEPGAEGTGGVPAELGLPNVGENSASTQTKQRDRDGEKSEMIGEDDAKEPGEGKFEQKRGEAAKA